MILTVLNSDYTGGVLYSLLRTVSRRTSQVSWFTKDLALGKKFGVVGAPEVLRWSVRGTNSLEGLRRLSSTLSPKP